MTLAQRRNHPTPHFS